MQYNRLKYLSHFFCSLLLLTGLVPGWTAPSFSTAITPQRTSYDLIFPSFANAKAAENALNSPDKLIRRYGVEWLGEWTSTDNPIGTVPDKKNCKQLYGQKSLVPSLSRAVREMPDEDSQQAARLLVLIGPSARPAIPLICTALVKQGTVNVFYQYEQMNNLIHLCGGVSAVAPHLVALMQDSDHAKRAAAAGAASMCDDIGFNHISIAPYGASVLSSSQSPVENIKFRAYVLPELTRHINDPVTDVRLAALKSLELLTADSGDACLISWQSAFDINWQKHFHVLWSNTLPPLEQALASPDMDVRLAALRVLAYMPGDVSSLTPVLRQELHHTQDEQKYALAALCHAAISNRILVSNVFLKDLSCPDLTQRRQAAADIRLTIMPLWDGSFFPDHEPLNWYSDDRLSFRDDDPTLTPKQKDDERKQQQIAQHQTQQHLLKVLLQACSDQDDSVRASAASSLDIIGQWAEAASAHGFLAAPTVKSDLTIKQVLTQARIALQSTDPDKAKRFQVMNGHIWELSEPFFRVRMQD